MGVVYKEILLLGCSVEINLCGIHRGFCHINCCAYGSIYNFLIIRLRRSVSSLGLCQSAFCISRMNRMYRCRLWMVSNRIPSISFTFSKCRT